MDKLKWTWAPGWTTMNCPLPWTVTRERTQSSIFVRATVFGVSLLQQLSLFPCQIQPGSVKHLLIIRLGIDFLHYFRVWICFWNSNEIRGRLWKKKIATRVHGKYMGKSVGRLTDSLTWGKLLEYQVPHL